MNPIVGKWIVAVGVVEHDLALFRQVRANDPGDGPPCSRLLEDVSLEARTRSWVTFEWRHLAVAAEEDPRAVHIGELERGADDLVEPDAGSAMRVDLARHVGLEIDRGDTAANGNRPKPRGRGVRPLSGIARPSVHPDRERHMKQNRGLPRSPGHADRVEVLQAPSSARDVPTYREEVRGRGLEVRHFRHHRERRALLLARGEPGLWCHPGGGGRGLGGRARG